MSVYNKRYDDDLQYLSKYVWPKQVPNVPIYVYHIFPQKVQENLWQFAITPMNRDISAKLYNAPRYLNATHTFRTHFKLANIFIDLCQIHSNLNCIYNARPRSAITCNAPLHRNASHLYHLSATNLVPTVVIVKRYRNTI